MTDGPLGGAAFNNEFGRPNVLGYFRAFQANVGGRRYGYHKPIMLAGGIGNIKEGQTHKLDLPTGTYLVVVLGGPGMRIGIGEAQLPLWPPALTPNRWILPAFSAAIRKWKEEPRKLSIDAGKPVKTIPFWLFTISVQAVFSNAMPELA